MAKEAITSVGVAYADGRRVTFQGNGTVDVVRTPNTARGAPVLRDDDLTYVQIVLMMPTPSAAPATATPAPTAAAP